MSTIAERLLKVRSRIAQAEATAGRTPGSVRLVAVSKRMPSATIREAYACGQRDFGENYVQELRLKAEELKDLPELRLHLIGHLQTNKVRSIVGSVSMIQSLDSVRLVEELAKRVQLPAVDPRRIWVCSGATTPANAPAVGLGKPSALPVLVEVGVAGEAQKSGCKPEELAEILAAVDAVPSLCACGLMTVPPFTDDPDSARPHFEGLRALRDAHGGAARLPELSMGMTLDLEPAILAGATIVRVGTALFGERTTPGVK
jgi:hypothetical protein